ncbi:MAG TPA: hypothetical protein VHA09_07170 [Nitrososphaera sp.]|nr:hypothetical protein [Nitrososphaera sp.]
MGKVRIVKEKKVTDYTFVEDTSLNLDNLRNNEEDVLDEKNNKGKTERDFRLREDTKINKIKHNSKITGGHNVQGHSPVYE